MSGPGPALDALATAGRLRRDAPLGPLTTYKFGGPARWLAEVGGVAELVEVLEARRADAAVPLLVLGRGSNVVIADAGFDGLVVRLAGEFLGVSLEGPTITAGGAVALPRLARFAVEHGRGGLEWCVGIPGSVGGAVVMNAGGHGSNTAEWLVDAAVLDADAAESAVLTAAGLDLGYRHSSLEGRHIVLSARFRTIGQPSSVGERLLREITRWRREHQPGGTLNAGSVFKNPSGDAAGRIIDALGLKGHAVGGAAVSHRHANFFEAGPGATAQDVHDLVASVHDIVAKATGIDLVPEIRFAGSFREAPGEPMPAPAPIEGRGR
ncbi:MAG TPA: UDP-N-acetylmuramate dehydrogenase [Acidimicrobiia bacterium]